jgi:DNA-directed RNA polymerase subunit omega
MKIETGFDSNYRKVLVAARRARQLQSGSRALVSSHSTKPCRIAQEEIDAGKIAYVKGDSPIVKPPIDGPAIPILAS